METLTCDKCGKEIHPSETYVFTGNKKRYHFPKCWRVKK